MDKSKSMRPKKVAELLGIGSATLWRWIHQKPGFPQPIRLSARCTVFKADEIEAWRANQDSSPPRHAGTIVPKQEAMRDVFAGQAMQAYCSDPEWRVDMDEDKTAEAAYRMADAMLKARLKTTN